jgi:nitrite reductase/ring-hydroxylating ferredoxin subunit
MLLRMPNCYCEGKDLLPMDFIRLAHVRDFANTRIKSFRMLGRLIAIVREPDGSFWATEIACKHQNADLVSEGLWRGDEVICKRHGWKYNFRTGQCLNQNSAPLRRHELKVIAGELHVSVQPVDPEPTSGDDPMPEVVFKPR